MKKLHLGLAAGTLALVVAGVAVWLVHRSPSGSGPSRSAEPTASHVGPPVWPDERVRLRAPTVVFPPDFGTRRVFVDPGHGAPGNTGNISSLCEDEQEFTLRASAALARELEKTGHFEVRLSRSEDELVRYGDRVREATAWRAEVFISVHSDVRGTVGSWSPEPDRTCPHSVDAPGFSVLWSDDAPPPLRERRVALARAIARQLQQAGFLAYGGEDYRRLYGADAEQAGVFVDRHAPGKRVFVLARPAMPSVIVETHNALDSREARRWNEAETITVWAATVAVALIDQLR